MLVGTIAAITMLLSFTIKTETKASLPGNTVITGDSKAVHFKNMQTAYKDAVTASAKYDAFSEKAEDEGQHQVAMMFNALSRAKSIHADNHQAALVESGQTVPEIDPKFEVRSTHENLKDAISEENNRINAMYPKFITDADKAGERSSLRSLNYAHKATLKHADFLNRALVALENDNGQSLSTMYYVCPTCGHIFDSDAQESCEVCGTNSEDFIEISD